MTDLEKMQKRAKSAQDTADYYQKIAFIIKDEYEKLKEETEKVRLLLCPFCGSIGEALITSASYVTCETCLADGPFKGITNRDEAIAAWNKRV